MPVPLFDLKDQNREIDAELKAAFERVLYSGQYIMGPEIEALEGELASFIGARFALGVSSGTDAILLALMSLGIGPGDEVICPTFTFFATAGCVARTGARPVFADSAPHAFNVDPADIERRITARTKAIIPVHLFGEMADMAAILEIAARRNIPVIEDAAQALGATVPEFSGSAGALGQFGAFSFFPTKNLGCLGDGGLLTTSDEQLAARARILRVHGMEPKYFHSHVGGNFRLDPLQAAFLRVKLSRYDEYTRKRRENAAYYLEKLGQLPGVYLSANDAPGEDAVILPAARVEKGPIWNQFTLRVRGKAGTADRRDALRAFLSERGIGSEIYYPMPLHTQECFASAGQVNEDFRNANALAREVLSIPIYPELSGEQKSEVVGAIAEFLGA